MIVYGHVWSTMDDMFSHVWLLMVIYGPLWLFMTVYNLEVSYLIMYGPVWLCVVWSLYGHV